MPGYNVQTYLEHMRFLLEHRLTSASSASYTDLVLLRYLNDAQRKVQEELGLDNLGPDATLSNLTSGTAFYDLPADLRGSAVKTLRIKNTSGDWNPLHHISMRFARDRYQLAADTYVTETLGEPVHWAFGRSNRQLLLLPTPDRSASNAIESTYELRPTPLHRVYQPATTAACTVASASVTLSGAQTGFAAEDEFGVIWTTQTDGETLPASLNPSPTIWYMATAVASTAVTISPVFAEPTNGTATWMAAQVSDLEKQMPGKMGFALPTYAAGLLLKAVAPEQAMLLIGDALSELVGITPDDDSTVELTTHGDQARRTTRLRGY